MCSHRHCSESAQELQSCGCNRYHLFSTASVCEFVRVCATWVFVGYIRYKSKLVSHSSKITATIMSPIFITVSNHLLEPENTHTHTHTQTRYWTCEQVLIAHVKSLYFGLCSPMSGYYLKFLFRPCVRLPIFIHCAVRFMQKNWDKLRKWVNTGSMWEAAQFLAGWWVLAPSKVWFVALKSIKKHANDVFIEKKAIAMSATNS